MVVTKITPTIQEFAILVQEAYKDKDKRRRKFILAGNEHNYIKENSTQLWCWYEDEKVILLGIHGADDWKLNIVAINQFINPDKVDKEIKNFCKIREKLLNTNKAIFIGAHSLGTWIVSSCELEEQSNIEAVMFGLYVPRADSPKAQIMASNKNFKKIFYDNDWFANNILKINNLINTIVLTPRTFSKSFLNGHSISNFTDNSVELLNMDITTIKKVNTEIREQEEVIGAGSFA